MIERSFTALIGELTHETTTLVRQEIQLAKEELSQKASQAGNGLAEVVAGALIIFLAMEALLGAAVVGLARAIGLWQAAVVLGVFILLIGAFVVIRGLTNLRADALAPARTMDSLRQNTRWAREQLR